MKSQTWLCFGWLVWLAFIMDDIFVLPFGFLGRYAAMRLIRRAPSLLGGTSFCWRYLSWAAMRGLHSWLKAF